MGSNCLAGLHNIWAQFLARTVSKCRKFWTVPAKYRAPPVDVRFRKFRNFSAGRENLAPDSLSYLCFIYQRLILLTYISTDINECDHPSMYPCINGTCTNTIGSYNCTCPAGTQSKDPKNSPCTPIPSMNKQHGVKVFIGIPSPL